MGYEKFTTIWQTEHEINTGSEIFDKTKCQSLTKKFHKGMTYFDPGIAVFEGYPFFATTPVLEINCACHAPGFVEIKSPVTLRKTIVKS